MIGILTTFVLIAIVSCFDIFDNLIRKHGYVLTNTCTSVIEAIQDIKAYKASKMK